MRPAIPIEERNEVHGIMEEMLPGLDKALVDELAADYILEALICIDLADLNYVLIRPGPFVSGALRGVSAVDFQENAEKLLKNLLAKHPAAGPPSGALIIFRLFPGLKFKQVGEVLSCLAGLLHEATEHFVGCFFDPDGTEAKIRICLVGDADLRSVQVSELRDY